MTAILAAQMGENAMAKKKKLRIKDSVLRKLLVVGAVLGVVASLLSVILLSRVSTLEARMPRAGAIQEEVTLDSRAQFYAQNFFTLWLTGSDVDSANLAEFYNAIPLTDLSPTPYVAADINVAAKKLSLIDGGDRLWTFTFGATTQAPGTATAVRNYYDVDVVQKDGGFKIVKLPEAVNFVSKTLTAKNAYTVRVADTSPLYQVSLNFAAAYLTPAGGSSFGRYVTGTFEGTPLSNSPYTATDIRGVFVPSGVMPDTIEAGGSTDVLIRVRASTSQATYVHMDLVVTATKQENGQWLISGFTSPKVASVTEKR